MSGLEETGTWEREDAGLVPRSWKDQTGVVANVGAVGGVEAALPRDQVVAEKTVR